MPTALEWQWPWAFSLLPLPLLIRWVAPATEQAAGAIRVPFYHQLQALQAGTPGQAGGAWLKALFAAVIWLCLVAAAARPTWIGEPLPLPLEGRDLMLAVDISQSMQERDMRVRGGVVSRIDAVKAVVGEFITERRGDRLGLILFGAQSYLQTPLTFDTATLNTQLQEARLGFAGNATAIGDALGLGVKRLRDRPAASRVLILLTDGANTAGTDPRQAAAIAAEAQIRIHTIGIGADAVRGVFGMRTRTALDEPLLADIATATGGQYFRARDPAELQQIYARLDALEPVPEEQTFRPRRSLLHLPLGLALALSALLAAGPQLAAAARTYRKPQREPVT
ncbi:MAG: VWA domain-containing protein [Cellvibrionales bacterium]|nr:VWA domain-containing protein [Cellvibrionales bacterium]